MHKADGILRLGMAGRVAVEEEFSNISARPWAVLWLAGVFWAAVPCGVLAPVLWAVGLLPSPFLLADVGACELVFFFVSSYKTCGFSSSWLLTSFFYTQVTIPSVSFFSQVSKQRLVVGKLLVEDKAWLISDVVDRLVCNF
ncbi:hypothetical protein M5K25_012359 [Dendrobium thyrsiflorum]|uniref:Uncharacterized protein n=1 Tax=Dendrobium thyrsiflorum TaxID=117978 RepID=A0ABD0UXC5_DENTH